jgi:hypothetical protein
VTAQAEPPAAPASALIKPLPGASILRLGHLLGLLGEHAQHESVTIGGSSLLLLPETVLTVAAMVFAVKVANKSSASSVIDYPRFPKRAWLAAKLGTLVATRDTALGCGRVHLGKRVPCMHFLEPSVVIAVIFSVAGLIATLASAVVATDRLAAAWRNSEPKARGSTRCKGTGRGRSRSRDCPAGARRDHHR